MGQRDDPRLFAKAKTAPASIAYATANWASNLILSLCWQWRSILFQPQQTIWAHGTVLQKLPAAPCICGLRQLLYLMAVPALLGQINGGNDGPKCQKSIHLGEVMGPHLGFVSRHRRFSEGTVHGSDRTAEEPKYWHEHL